MSVIPKFTADSWQHLLNVQTEDLPLPQDLDTTVLQPSPWDSTRKIQDLCMLVLVPGKPLQWGPLLDKAKEKIKSCISDPLGTINPTLPKKSYWALVTTEVVPDTPSKTFETQVELVTKGGFRPPRLEEASIAIWASYLQKMTWIYPYYGGAFTRCDRDDIIVGAFNGKKTNSFIDAEAGFSFFTDEPMIQDDGYGMGAVKSWEV